MRIAKKFKINAIVSAVIILLIMLTQFMVVKQTNAILKKNAIVEQIVESAFGLNLVTLDYLMEHSKRAYTQWTLRHGSLSRLMQKIVPENISEQLLLDKMKRNHENLKAIFAMLGKKFKTRKNGEEATIRSAELQGSSILSKA